MTAKERETIAKMTREAFEKTNKLKRGKTLEESFEDTIYMNSLGYWGALHDICEELKIDW